MPDGRTAELLWLRRASGGLHGPVMTVLVDADAEKTGLDAAAVKPSEAAVEDIAGLPFDRVTIDYEGPDHVPPVETLRSLARSTGAELRVTVPVRADGFDPLGDDRYLARLPDGIKTVLVAGHPAYLSETEASRPIAPRLGAALEATTDPWVGTEGIERLALATGATQFLLLSPTLEDELRSLRAAGFEGDLAVYAPTVMTDAEGALLNAVGGYVARRGPVSNALPEGARTDDGARGRARQILLESIPEYALTGDEKAISARVDELKAAGADHVVGYPARGLDAFLS